MGSVVPIPRAAAAACLWSTVHRPLAPYQLGPLQSITFTVLCFSLDILAADVQTKQPCLPNLLPSVISIMNS
jgi:hypothetical protein